MTILCTARGQHEPVSSLYHSHVTAHLLHCPFNCPQNYRQGAILSLSGPQPRLEQEQTCTSFQSRPRSSPPSHTGAAFSWLPRGVAIFFCGKDPIWQRPVRKFAFLPGKELNTSRFIPRTCRLSFVSGDQFDNLWPQIGIRLGQTNELWRHFYAHVSWFCSS